MTVGGHLYHSTGALEAVVLASKGELIGRPSPIVMEASGYTMARPAAASWLGQKICYDHLSRLSASRVSLTIAPLTTRRIADRDGGSHWLNYLPFARPAS